MASAAEQEAKQLDSVTDRVQEKELDASKATEAMAGFNRPNPSASDAAAGEVRADDTH
jgi:hypothetical protein